MPLLHHLEPGDPFPPSDTALSYPNGLLAAGGALDEDTLLAAYRRGIFPWYEAPQPVLWWTPDPRSVLFPDDIRVSRSLRRTLRRDHFRLSADTVFSEVMSACAQPREGQAGTWIDHAMIAAYRTLHCQGWAHSIEVRDERGTLVGGLYGVAIGGVFFGESMFSRASDASKVALLALRRLLLDRGMEMIDCQIESDHLNSLGARNIPRVDFEKRLQQTVCKSVDSRPWIVPATSGELL